MGYANEAVVTEMDGFVIAHITAAKSSAIVNDLLGGACRLYALFAIGEAAVVDYVKLWDNTAPTGGSTAPDFSLKIVGDAAGDGITPIFFDPDGEIFDNGLSVGADDDGGTAIGDSPTTLPVTMVLKRGVS